MFNGMRFRTGQQKILGEWELGTDSKLTVAFRHFFRTPCSGRGSPGKRFPRVELKPRDQRPWRSSTILPSGSFKTEIIRLAARGAG